MSTVPSQPRFEPARIIIVMGVSSSGKSSVGRALGHRLRVPFLDGDGYHPAANKDKMRLGIPLTDEDRWPWLEALAHALRDTAQTEGAAIGACSALKRVYREYLTETASQPILFVFLEGAKDVITRRIARRAHEFMPASLLDSQFATLEVPAPDENVLKMSILDPVETIASKVVMVLDHLTTLKRGQ
jgi:gluconokinase